MNQGIKSLPGSLDYCNRHTSRVKRTQHNTTLDGTPSRRRTQRHTAPNTNDKRGTSHVPRQAVPQPKTGATTAAREARARGEERLPHRRGLRGAIAGKANREEPTGSGEDQPKENQQDKTPGTGGAPDKEERGTTTPARGGVGRGGGEVSSEGAQKDTLP